ncbi:TPA: hypothetical protein ACY2HE_001663 [Yersinia enterocolitica]
MQHNTFYKNLTFNKLIIIDCLPDDELQTAKRLCENLNDSGFGCGVTLIKTQNDEEFRSIIQNIKDSFKPELELSFLPIIHIEAHGSPHSMELPDKSTISWQELADELRSINKLMNNQLISFIGTCHGYHFIHNNHTIKNFTPVYFCIAPLDEISAGDIESATNTFYLNLFSTGNLSNSANLMSPSKFYTYNADYMFHRVFYENMQKNHKGTALKTRKEKLIGEAIQQMGKTWDDMNLKHKKLFLKKARNLINFSLKSKESLRIIFDEFSTAYMGYADENVFEEIWMHMQQNKQGSLY